MNILVAEDEEDIRSLIAEQLIMEGYHVIAVSNGTDALYEITKGRIDIAILDIMMPQIDGFTVLAKIRETSEMPIIFVTARGEDFERALGLRMGADDYIVKPFSMVELSARVAVQVKHLRALACHDQKEDRVVCGELILEKKSSALYKNGIEISLNAKEFLMIKYFMENMECVLTKKQIYQAVWREDYVYDDNTIMVYLSHIRSKIEDNSREPKYLLTMKGLGYKFRNPDRC
ncbi:MAG: response regulator transcription factor [Velocimicrobium sp.]